MYLHTCQIYIPYLIIISYIINDNIILKFSQSNKSYNINISLYTDLYYGNYNTFNKKKHAGTND